MVYIDQPVTTGFSRGNITVNNEDDVATQFKGFWKNFIKTFSMQGYKIYITGESYAGQYIPYIASGMLDEDDCEYFNLKGININDPSINNDNTLIYCKSPKLFVSREMLKNCQLLSSLPCSTSRT
jgi:carboxypeptidase D